jgi:glycosyltransferase involved in cell wall biosynthesis
LIERAVYSVLNQTYSNFELIIVDDFSKDNTYEIISKIKDARIVYIKHKKNMGAAAARNTGIAMAKGEYIAFQDSDDEWATDKLSLQMQTMMASPSRVGVVYCAFWRIDGMRKEFIPGKRIRHLEGDIHAELLKGNFVATPTTLIRKHCFIRSGVFDDTLLRFHDWELFLRISKYFHFLVINQPLVIAYPQENSISNSREGLLKALSVILCKHYDEFLKYSPKNLSDKLGWLARLYYDAKEYQRSLDVCNNALSVYPRNAVKFFPLIILLRLKLNRRS